MAIKTTKETIRVIDRAKFFSFDQFNSPSYQPLEWREITTKFLHIFNFKIKLWTKTVKHTKG